MCTPTCFSGEIRKYVVGTHLKPLNVVLLMSIHNIHFCGKNIKLNRMLFFQSKSIDYPHAF